jgi:sugar lactone lactonase YvrE
MASTDQPTGNLELVATLEPPMPTGVTVSHTGRIFVNHPRWGDDVAATVVELRDGVRVPYPSAAWNQPDSDDDRHAFVSVQCVVVDPVDRLWVVDTGAPMLQPTRHGGPKLVRVDLDTDAVGQVITFPTEVALPSSYLNDVRFDLRRGDQGTAFVTDSANQGPNGIIVVDLATGESWRRLHDHPSTKAPSLHTSRPVVEGRYFLSRPGEAEPSQLTFGSDGIAISADGSRLFYCPLMSRRFYSVSVDALCDRSMDDSAVAATVVDEGDKGSCADGLETDDQNRLYITAYEQNSVFRRTADGEFETLVHDPRLLWPDTLSVATDGHLYVTANQLHRGPDYNDGKDLRQPPYAVFRVAIDAGPVLLRP